MTIKGSGQLGLNGTCTGGSSARDQIGAEVNKTAGTTLCLNNACLRTLSGTSAGTQVSFSTFYGKSSSFTYTVSANQTNFCMRAGAVSAGWNQTSALVVNINSGVIISSNSTGTPAMTISGSYAGGVSVKNNGTIVGMGGNGGRGGDIRQPSAAGVAGSTAGTALKISSTVTICNSSGVIAGGGGGGGGGGVANCQCCYDAGGGGGGGGRSSNAANSSGGAAGFGNFSVGSAGGAGTYSAAGSGGAGGTLPGAGPPRGGTGGAGGGWGSAGSSGQPGQQTFQSFAGGSGGAGGKATCGSAFVTWTATGTRYGSIS